MIKHLVHCGLLVISFSMCSGPTEKQGLREDLKTFKSDYDTLHVLELPLNLNRESWIELANKHYEKFGVRGGYDLLTMPFGKLVDSELFKGIIFIYDNPILITIDRNQHPVDTLFLLGDDFSNDPSISTIETARVHSDLTIQLIDSVFTYEVENEQNRIERTEKLTVNTSNFRIDKTGHIKKIE